MSELYDYRELALGSPHITADGLFMSLFSYSKEEGMRAYRFDLMKRRLDFIFSHSFPEPCCVANHLMICPTNENLFFFAHEGDTSLVSDRLWIYDARKGEARNIAVQKIDDHGAPLDCFGHEAWSHDGKSIYFVKYVLSPSKPQGICRASLCDGKYELLYSKYGYWHTSVSDDGSLIAADTSDETGMCSVVLIDNVTGEEMLVERIRSRKKHPNHPHPSVSPNNSALVYNYKSDSEFDGVRIALLEK